MKSFIPLIAAALLVPIQALASTPGGCISGCTPSSVPVPEPLSLALLGAGLAGLGGAAVIRRRRQK